VNFNYISKFRILGCDSGSRCFFCVVVSPHVVHLGGRLHEIFFREEKGDERIYRWTVLYGPPPNHVLVHRGVLELANIRARVPPCLAKPANSAQTGATLIPKSSSTCGSGFLISVLSV
jgi:hypothetical protein